MLILVQWIYADTHAMKQAGRSKHIRSRCCVFRSVLEAEWTSLWLLKSAHAFCSRIHMLSVAKCTCYIAKWNDICGRMDMSRHLSL